MGFSFCNSLLQIEVLTITKESKWCPSIEGLEDTAVQTLSRKSTKKTALSKNKDFKNRDAMIQSIS